MIRFPTPWRQCILSTVGLSPPYPLTFSEGCSAFLRWYLYIEEYIHQYIVFNVGHLKSCEKNPGTRFKRDKRALCGLMSE